MLGFCEVNEGVNCLKIEPKNWLVRKKKPFHSENKNKNTKPPQYPTCLDSRCTYLPFKAISFFKHYCLALPWLPIMNWNRCVILFISSHNCAETLAVSFEQLKETGCEVGLTKASNCRGGRNCWDSRVSCFWLARFINIYSVITDIANVE